MPLRSATFPISVMIFFASEMKPPFRMGVTHQERVGTQQCVGISPCAGFAKVSVTASKVHLHAGAIIAVHGFGVVLGVVADFFAGGLYVEYVVGIVRDDVVVGAGS